jgi:hypothetical protein
MNNAAISEGRGRKTPFLYHNQAISALKIAAQHTTDVTVARNLERKTRPKRSSNNLLGFDFCIAVQRGISRDSEKKTRRQFEGGVSLALPGIGIE